MSSLSPEAVRDLIIEETTALGFHRIGLIPIEAPARYQAYRDWLDAGHAGSMAYMADPEHIAHRADLRTLAAEARTMLVVASAYAGHDRDRPPTTGGIHGTIARYARGRDYHQVMKRKLHTLAANLSERLGRSIAARVCVDTAPVLERDFAERAGIGFVAKNTMLIAPGLGSYVLLGELLLDVDATPTSEVREQQRCGTCTACLDACPTGAFADPFVLDARKCISYLTIEHRGTIPHHLRAAIGTMIFGCDICQQVCPFNQAAPARTEPDPELATTDERHSTPDLLDLITLGANQRRRYIDGTALRRVNRAQLLRNVCVALGNAGEQRAVGPLTEVLTDRSPLVRAHAAWALGQLGARAELQAALPAEADAEVRGEIEGALAALLT